MSAPSLLVRADGSVAIGTGHVMRCLALAQAWQDAGGTVVFAMVEPLPALGKRLRAEGITVACMSVEPGSAEDASQSAELAKSHGATWVVVDGYRFHPDFQRRLKDAGLKVLFIDDNGEGHSYCADIVLNQNVYASKAAYLRREGYTVLLLGSRYAMLRREFARWRGWKRQISPSGSKVLVAMGGTDASNLTERVIEALAMLESPEIQARVIVGSSNPHLAALQSAVSRSGRDIELAMNPSDIPDLMAWADVAVSAAGSTCWELCFFGLPSLVMDVAENQRGIARALEQKGAADYLGWGADVATPTISGRLRELIGAADIRARISLNANNLVDGYGAARVASAMRWAGIHLRRANETDCRILWEWVNDPEVRAASFSSDPIPWEEHVEWFGRKLHDPSSLIFVAADEHGLPLGQVRFDLVHNGDFETDVSVSRERRASGLGASMMARALQHAFQENNIQRLHAFVKPDNRSSIRLFEESGFHSIGAAETKGCESIHYIYEREHRRVQ